MCCARVRITWAREIGPVCVRAWTAPGHWVRGASASKNRRHTPEQTVRKLRETDRLLGEGHELPEVLKFFWGLGGDVPPVAGAGRRDEGRRRCQGLKVLEAENVKLKRIVADHRRQQAARFALQGPSPLEGSPPDLRIPCHP